MSPILVDGPLANNAVVCQALAALLPESELYVSRDALEGTARGAWMLTRWTSTRSFHPAVERLRSDNLVQIGLMDAWSRWMAALPIVSSRA